MRCGKLLLSFFAIATLCGADEKRFDIASVRPASPDAKYGFRFGPGGRFVDTNCRLKDLLMLGWRLQSFQIGELPGWMESERFNVEAIAEGIPDEDEFRVMIQSLLKERFHLLAHILTKESVIYSLEIARAGVKTSGLAQTRENECIQPEFNGTYIPPQSGRHPLCAVGERLASQNDGTVLMQMYATGVTMDVLARALGSELAQHVENDTKLGGSFDFSFDFAPDPARSLNFPGTGFDSGGPSLFTALEEKLGLQLRSGRGKVEMLVVDHAEQPSEN